MSRGTWFVLVTVLLGGSIAAQEEAPDYQLIPEVNQRLSRVEATGTWTAKAALGWAGGWNDQGFVPSASYGDFAKGFVFSQVPDFSLGVRLLDRYLLRVVYTGSVEENSFEIGYDGLDGELLRWVRAGNTPFEVPARAGTSVAPGRTGNPAFGLGWATPTAEGELTVRYEDNSRETRDYRGFTPLSGPRISLTNWVRGRFFQLPGLGPWNNLKLWFEDPLQSSGQVLAGPSDVRFDEATGSLELAKAAFRRVWVEWDGQPSLLLYDTGLATGFETQDHFLLPEGFDERSRIQVIDTTTGAEVSGYQVTTDPLAGWVMVRPASVPVSAANARQELSVLPPLSTDTQWHLGSDVEASSLVVTRNGFETRDWDFQSASGTLVPRFAVADSDEIHMTFQSRQKSGRTADALGWLGASWQVIANQSIDANFWVKWNSVKDRYTTQESQAPGHVAGTLQWKGTQGPLTWDLRSEASARLADSTGTRHLLNWSANTMSVALTSESLRPAAAPRVVLGSLTPTAANRALAVFRDFTAIDPLTGASVIGAWRTGQPAEPLGPGGLTGPYLVRGDELSGDRAAVLEVTMATGQWAGLQVFFDRGLAQDLSSRSHLDLGVRFPESVPAGVRVFFVAGALGENFDGSGVVKTVKTGTRITLDFADSVHNATLGFPVPEGSEWTNDGNGDGVSTNGGTPLMIEITNRLDSLSGAWQSVGLDLDESQRALLAQTTSWGILLSSESGASVTTTVLARTAAFAGSSWDIAKTAIATAGSSIAVKDVVNPSGDNATVLTWTQRPDWSVAARFPGFRPSTYRRLTWQYELTVGGGANPPPTVLQFLAGDTIAAEYRWTPAVSTSSLSIDLATGQMTNGGSVIEPTIWNRAVTTWDRVCWSSSQTPDGVLRLGPPKATDPLWDLGVVTDAVTRVAWQGQDIQLTMRSLVSSTTGTQWSAQSTWTSRLGPLTATWNGEWEPSGLVHTGYDLGLNLELSNGGPALRLTDALTDRLSRRITAELKVPVLGTIAASQASQWVGRVLEQNSMASWGSPQLDPAFPELKASLEGRLSHPGALPAPEWSTLWTESLGWMVPTLSVRESTWGRARARLSWRPNDWAVATDAEASVLQLTGSPWSVTTNGLVTVSLPWVQSDPAPWIVTSQASAKYSSTTYSALGLPVPDVVSFGQGVLMTLPTSSPDFRRDINLKLEIARLPFQFVGGAGWSQGAVSNLPYAQATQNLQTQFRWNNLFGRAGIWPLMTWYRTDGLSLRWQVNLGQGTRGTDNTVDLGNVWEPEVLLTSTERISWPLQWTWKSSTATRFDLSSGPQWSWRGPAKLPLVLPDWISPTAFDRQLGFETRSDVGIGWNSGAGWSLDRWQVSEKISLTLSPRSEVHLSLRWGNAWQNHLVIVALEASLEAVLSF